MINKGINPGESTNYSGRAWLIFFLAIIGGTFLCGSTVYVGLDVTCYNDARTWLEDYPGAELVEETYTFFRPFGIGETTRILYTEDAERDVRNWYFRRDQRINATGARRDDNIGFMRWFVDEAQDGQGTQIVLYSECASDMELS